MPVGPSIIYFDLETTGLSVMDDQIVQIGAVCEDKVFNCYIRAEKEMHQRAKEVIQFDETPEYLEAKKNEPNLTIEEWVDRSRIPTKEGLQKFVDFLEGIPKPRMLVGFNSLRFDMPLLLSELWRWDFKLSAFPVEELGDVWFWTFKVPSHHFFRNEKGQPIRKLGKVYRAFFEEELKGAHGAVADAQATKRLAEDYRISPHIECEIMANDFVKDFIKDRKVADKKDYPHKKRKVASILSFITKKPPKKKIKT